MSANFYAAGVVVHGWNSLFVQTDEGAELVTATRNARLLARASSQGYHEAGANKGCGWGRVYRFDRGRPSFTAFCPVPPHEGCCDWSCTHPGSTKAVSQ